MQHFDRRYRLSAGAAGGMGFEIGETSIDRPTALHISFMIDKCDTETPNSAQISIWNLNKEQLSILNKPDCVVVLKAGYDRHMPLIFVGNVVHTSTKHDGADRETVIELVDGGVCLRDTYISLSFRGKTEGLMIAQRIAEQMGVALTISHNAKFHTFEGFSFAGLARTALDKVCATTDLQWGVHNGVLQIKRANDTMSKEVYTLSPDSGLIGIPSRTMVAADASGEETPGWEIKTLLNGAVNVSDYIRLESRYVKGYFRVVSISISGDNIEGEWASTFSLADA